MNRKSFLARVGAALALIPVFSREAKAKLAGISHADAVSTDNFDPEDMEDVFEKINAAMQKLPDAMHLRIEYRGIVSRDGNPDRGYKLEFARIFTSGIPNIPVRDRNSPEISVITSSGWQNIPVDFK